MWGKKSRVEKAVAKDDDFDLDFDFDMDMPDGWDSDGTSDDFASNSKNRHPAIKATKDIVKGISDAALEPSTMANFMKKMLPSAYGEVMDNASKGISELKSNITDAKSELNQVKRNTQDLFRKAGAFAEAKGAERLSKMLQKLAGEEEQRYQEEKASKEDEIQSTLNSLFAKQALVNEQREKVKSKEKEAEQALESTRFDANFKTLSSIDKTVRTQLLFANKNTFNYYRKSIEIGLRQYHVMADIYKVQTESSEKILQALNDIKLNSGLPDYVKLQNKEALKQLVKNKTYAKLYDGAAGLLGGMSRTLRDMVSGGIGNLRDFSDQFSELGDVFDLAGEDVNTTRLGASMGTSSLAGLLGKLAKRKLQGTEHYKKLQGLNNRVQNFNDNMGDYVLSGLDKLRNKIKGDGPTADLGLNIIDFLTNFTRQSMDNKNKIRLENEGFSYSDFNGPGGLQNQAARNTATVIPGYLARILREIRWLRTGQRPELVEFNYRNNKFMNESDHTRDLIRNVVGSGSRESFRNHGKSTLSRLQMYKKDYLGKEHWEGGFDEKSAQQLGDILTQAALKGIALTPEWLSNPANFIRLGPERAQAIAKKFSDQFEKDSNENTSVVNDIGRSTRSLTSNVDISTSDLEAINNMGYGHKLLGSGIVDREGTVNNERILKILSGEGFAKGGYTGPGNKYEVKGQVHAEETVFNREDTKFFGASFLENLRKVRSPKDALRLMRNLVASKSSGTASTSIDTENTEVSLLKQTALTNSWLENISNKMSYLVSATMDRQIVGNIEDFQTDPNNKSLSLMGRNFLRNFTRNRPLPTTPEGKQKSLLRQNLEFTRWLGTAGIRMSGSLAWRTGKLLGSTLSGSFGFARDKVANLWGSTNDKRESIMKFATEQKDKFMDVYQEGIKDPVLKAVDLAKGRLRVLAEDGKMKIITKWEDIKSDIYDENGNLVLSYEDFKKGFVNSKGTKKLISAFSWFKNIATSKFGLLAAGTALLGPIVPMLYLAKKAYSAVGGKKGLIEKFNRTKARVADVYVKGNTTPSLYAKTFREGKYYCIVESTTGNDYKQIFSPVDIVGAVVHVDDPDKILLTKEDLEKGIVDVYGNEFTREKYTISGVLSSAAVSLAGRATSAISAMASSGARLIGSGIDLTKSIFAWGADKLSGGLSRLAGRFDSAYDSLKGKVRNATQAAFAQMVLLHESSRIQYAIYTLLDARLPNNNSSILGDEDGDGDRDNGIKDVKQKERREKARRAEEAAQMVRDSRLAKMIGASINGGKLSKDKEEEEESLFGSLIDSLTGGIGSRLMEMLGMGADAADFADLGEDGRRSRRRGRGSRGSNRNSGRWDRIRNSRLGQRFGNSRIGQGLGNLRNRMGNSRLGRGLGATGRGLRSVGRFGMGALRSLPGLAMRGLGLAGAGYSAYSAYQNLQEGNYGAAALDTAMGAGSLAMSGVSLSALGSGAMAAGSFLVSNPIGWAILGTAAIAGAGYALYKWRKNNKITPAVEARMYQYGFGKEENKDEIKKLLAFERSVSEALTQSPTGLIIDINKLNGEELLDTFGVDKNNPEQCHKWAHWYDTRFKPVFMSAIKILKSINPKYTIEDATDLEGKELKRYLNGIKPAKDRYTDPTSPFPAIAALTKSGNDALVFINDLINKTPDTEKPKDERSTLRKIFDWTPPGMALRAGKWVGEKASDLAKGVWDKAKGLWDKGKELFGKVADSTIGRGLLALLPGIGPVLAATLSAKKLIGSSISGSSGDPNTVIKDVFNVIKLKMYGLNNVTEDKKVRNLIALEQAVLPFIKQRSNGVVFDGTLGEIVTSTCELFGINKDDNKRIEVYSKYLEYRFIPALVNILSGIRKQTGKITLDVGVIDSTKKLSAISDALNAKITIEKQEGTVWSYSESPWGDGKLNTDSTSVDPYLKEMEKTVKEKGLSTRKTEALEKKMQAEATSGGYSRVLDIAGTAAKIISNPLGALMDNFSKMKDTVMGAFGGGMSAEQAVEGTNTAIDGANMMFGAAGNLVGMGTGGTISNVPAPTGKGWAATKATIMAASKLVGVDPGLMAGMAAQESGLDPNIRATGSSATGLFQFINSTWQSMVKRYGAKYGIPMGTPPTNGAANAILGAQYMKDNYEALKKYGEVTPGDIYLAHFLGTGGAQKALKAPQNALFSSIFPKEAKANPGIAKAGYTVADVRRQLTQNMIKKHAQFGIDVPIGGGITTTGTTTENKSLPVGALGGFKPGISAIAADGSGGKFGLSNIGSRFGSSAAIPARQSTMMNPSYNAAYQRMQSSNVSTSNNSVLSGTVDRAYGSSPTAGNLPRGTSATPWMDIARAQLGKNEKTDDPWIRECHRTCNLNAGGKMPWCASFVNWVLLKAGVPGTRSAAAISFKDWGVAAPSGTYPYGAVLVLNFGPKKNHVSFCVGAEGNMVKMLGGNQSSKKGGNQQNGGEVTISAVPKSRVVAVRLAPGYNGRGIESAVGGYASSVGSARASAAGTYNPRARMGPATKSTGVSAASNMGLTNTVGISTAMGSTGTTQTNRVTSDGYSAISRMNPDDFLSGTISKVSRTDSSPIDTHVEQIQSSLRNLFGVSSNGDLNVVNALKSTATSRAMIKNNMDNSINLTQALTQARQDLGKTGINELKSATDKSIDQSKSVAENLLIAQNNLLTETKEQTKVLKEMRDILAEIRANKSNTGNSPSDKVSYRNEVTKRNNTKANPVNLKKGNQ